ncbi:hypothetical protein LXL04_016241 [Taraxacum kok-saghyz]
MTLRRLQTSRSWCAGLDQLRGRAYGLCGRALELIYSREHENSPNFLYLPNRYFFQKTDFGTSKHWVPSSLWIDGKWGFGVRRVIEMMLGSFENSYISENPRTPKPLTFSKNRLRYLSVFETKQKNVHICKKCFLHICKILNFEKLRLLRIYIDGGSLGIFMIDENDRFEHNSLAISGEVTRFPATTFVPLPPPPALRREAASYAIFLVSLVTKLTRASPSLGDHLDAVYDLLRDLIPEGDSQMFAIDIKVHVQKHVRSLLDKEDTSSRTGSGTATRWLAYSIKLRVLRSCLSSAVALQLLILRIGA